MELVFDRTQADVLLGNEKGCYGPADLNRVETAVAQLCGLMEKLDIYPELTVKTDWAAPGIFSVQSWPVQSQMERYLQNVRRLCDAVALEAVLPQNMRWLDWQKANQIEKALHEANKRVQGIFHTYYYSGECFAGEENGL